MSTDYVVRYASAPTLAFRDPLCTACSVAVRYNGDDLICPTCGTSWPTNADDDTAGTLYEDWSGEKSGAPLTDLDDGWKTVMLADSAKRQAVRAALPHLP